LQLASLRWVLPPHVDVRLDETMLDYWHRRVEQHLKDSYAGVPMSKFPEDLRVYEHLLWEAKPNVVIEIGAQFGGSALWFRDRLRVLAHYTGSNDIRVVSVDVDASAARESLAALDPGYAQTIAFLDADVLDPQTPGRVEKSLPPNAACFVVEDSAHTYETTLAALGGFARFVPPNGYFVVEDGCVDIEEMRGALDWPRGVLPAIGAWLETDEGSRFTVRRDLELYGLSCHPGGFLQRLA
jgi:cephalosporin hydroxylase